jgi:hypothetical protein
MYELQHVKGGKAEALRPVWKCFGKVAAAISQGRGSAGQLGTASPLFAAIGVPEWGWPKRERSGRGPDGWLQLRRRRQGRGGAMTTTSVLGPFFGAGFAQRMSPLRFAAARNRLRKRDAQLFLLLGSALRDLPRRDGRFVLSSVCSASRAAPRSPLGRSFPVAIATGGRGGDRWLQPRPLGLGGGATQISLKQPHVRCNYTNPTASGYQ